MIGVPVTWRDEAEHRRLLAQELNRRLTNSDTQIGAYTDLTTGSPSTVSFSVPEWAASFEVILVGLSLSGTNDLDARLGDASGIATTGYESAFAGPSSSSAILTAEIGLGVLGGAGRTYTGVLSGRLVDRETNTWFCSHQSLRTGLASVFDGAGTVSLPGPITTVQIKSSGADTIDAGSGVIRYW